MTTKNYRRKTFPLGTTLDLNMKKIGGGVYYTPCVGAKITITSKKGRPINKDISIFIEKKNVDKAFDEVDKLVEDVFSYYSFVASAEDNNDYIDKTFPASSIASIPNFVSASIVDDGAVTLTHFIASVSDNSYELRSSAPESTKKRRVREDMKNAEEFFDGFDLNTPIDDEEEFYAAFLGIRHVPRNDRFGYAMIKFHYGRTSTGHDFEGAGRIFFGACMTGENMRTPIKDQKPKLAYAVAICSHYYFENRDSSAISQINLPKISKKLVNGVANYTPEELIAVFSSVPKGASVDSILKSLKFNAENSNKILFTADDFSRTIQSISHLFKSRADYSSLSTITNFMLTNMTRGNYAAVKLYSDVATSDSATEKDVKTGFSVIYHDDSIKKWLKNGSGLRDSKDVILEQLMSVLPSHQIYRILNDLVKMDAPLTYSNWMKFISNIDEYKDMPVSWWRPMI